MNAVLRTGMIFDICFVFANVTSYYTSGDCAAKNLMDASALYPMGFHPVNTNFLSDAVTPAPRLPGYFAQVKYYYVDYGISSYFPPDTTTDRLALGTGGRDQEVPELSTTTPYNPFKVDIVIIGNLLRHEFHEVRLFLRCHSLRILDPSLTYPAAI